VAVSKARDLDFYSIYSPRMKYFNQYEVWILDGSVSAGKREGSKVLPENF
jgi:hypothetical protein